MKKAHYRATAHNEWEKDERLYQLVFESYPGALVSIDGYSRCNCGHNYKIIEIPPYSLKVHFNAEFAIPEVSWVGLLLEGMEGFSSPFESLRTILWY